MPSRTSPLFMLGNAFVTAAVENQIIFLYYEISGSEKRSLLELFVDIEHLAAGTTLEVVVIAQPGHLIPIGFARELDRQNPALSRQILQCSIDRRNTQRWDDSLSR